MGVSLYDSPHPNKSSFEEILEIINYSLPCVNMASLSVDDTTKWPQDDLLKLLSIYEHSAFAQITSYDFPVSNFLLPHVPSELLKDLDVHGATCSPALKEAVRDAALNKEWQNLNIDVDNAEFDLDFLEAMFQKPVTQAQEYHFNFSFEKSALNDFKRDWQTSTQMPLEWKRPDGVKIGMTVRNITHSVCSIKFWMNL